KLAIAAKTAAVNQAAGELNPPIAVLTSYFAILSDGEMGHPPDRWIVALRVMADKAWRLKRVVDELVDAARVESGEITPHRSEVDLRDVVKKAIDRARPRVELTGAEIVTKLGTAPVQVKADADQLGRILDNVISNGLTYTAGPPRLVVTLGTERRNAIVRIADNGLGLSAEEQDQIFEPFTRGPNPVFDGVSGPGLGLYIGRQLAEANGGALTIESSEPGRGSGFALLLPLAPSALSPA
ncbi:MAG: sensor histidine kinase, partial [Candidatus Dormibacteraceae bacterium]